MKTLFKVLVGLVLVLAIVLVVGILNLDKGIKAAVETVGSRLTQSEVTLRDADLSLRSGEGSLTGLKVGNPQGFEAPNAFTLGKISLKVDTDSVASGPIVIDTLHIIAPEVSYEQGVNGTNIARLQQNIKQAIGDQRSSAVEEPKEEQGKKLIIRDLQVSGGKVRYINPLLGSKPATVSLPDLQLTGIGEKTNGATAAEAVNQIVAAINKNAVKALSEEGLMKNIPRDAIEQGKSRLEGVMGGLKGMVGKDDEE